MVAPILHVVMSGDLICADATFQQASSGFRNEREREREREGGREGEGERKEKTDVHFDMLVSENKPPSATAVPLEALCILSWS